MNVNILLLVACCVVFLPPIRTQDQCEGESDGHTIAIPGVCSDFHICMHGQEIRLSCGTMYFNPKTHTCDAPEAVDCSVPSEETSTANVCDKRHNGDLVASTENCSDFYVCVGKVALPRTCGWMHFDGQSGKCIDARFSRCDKTKFKPKIRPLVKFNDHSGPILVNSQLIP